MSQILFFILTYKNETIDQLSSQTGFSERRAHAARDSLVSSIARKYQT